MRIRTRKLGVSVSKVSYLACGPLSEVGEKGGPQGAGGHDGVRPGRRKGVKGGEGDLQGRQTIIKGWLTVEKR